MAPVTRNSVRNGNDISLEFPGGLPTAARSKPKRRPNVPSLTVMQDIGGLEPVIPVSETSSPTITDAVTASNTARTANRSSTADSHGSNPFDVGAQETDVPSTSPPAKQRLCIMPYMSWFTPLRLSKTTIVIGLLVIVIIVLLGMIGIFYYHEQCVTAKRLARSSEGIAAGKGCWH